MSPRNDEENQRIREERREKILAAASKVFAFKGLAATKIVDIAAAAGISHGLLYHYFASKEEIFAILIDRAMSGALMMTRGAQAQPGTPWARLRWMTAGMLEGVRAQSEYFMVVLQAMTSDTVAADVREKAFSQGEISRQAMIRLITEGQQAGEVVAGPPSQLATTFYSCIQGLAISVSFGAPLTMEFPTVDQVMRILKP